MNAVEISKLHLQKTMDEEPTVTEEEDEIVGILSGESNNFCELLDLNNIVHTGTYCSDESYYKYTICGCVRLYMKISGDKKPMFSDHSYGRGEYCTDCALDICKFVKEFIDYIALNAVQYELEHNSIGLYGPSVPIGLDFYFPNTFRLTDSEDPPYVEFNNLDSFVTYLKEERSEMLKVRFKNTKSAKFTD